MRVAVLDSPDQPAVPRLVLVGGASGDNLAGGVVNDVWEFQ